MSTTEERIAAAFAARAGEVEMGTSTIEERLSEVRGRTAQDRRNRRRLQAAAGGLGIAAAAAAAFALAGGLLDDDDRTLPQPAQEVPAEAVPLGPGSGNPAPGRYAAQSLVSLAFTLPDTGDVPGAWHYEYDAEAFGVGLDRSVATGHAAIGLRAPEVVYDPTAAQPFTEATPTVPAPTDVDGWVTWLETTGVVEVAERTEVEIDGVTATRLEVAVSQDVVPGGSVCAPSEACVPLSPDGPRVIASGRGAPFTSQLLLIPLDGRLLVGDVSGRADTEDQWLPLMQSVLESLDFR